MIQCSFLDRKQLSSFGEFLTVLHSNERGDNENLGRLLILALILIPLVILIVVFGNEIAAAAKKQWDALIKAPVKQPT